MNLRRLIELKCDEATDELIHMKVSDITKERISNLLKSKMFAIVGDEAPMNISQRRKAGANIKVKRKISVESEGFTQNLFNMIQHSNGLKLSEIVSLMNLKKQDKSKINYHLNKLRAENKIKMRGTRATARYYVK